MRKLLLAALAALAVLLAAGSAGAVINGEPDGERHPYVVALGFIDASTGRPGAFCSGTLISPTVVLTAGHCTYGSAVAFVWPGAVWSPAIAPAAMGMPMTHPDFNPVLSTPNTGDLGVVLLNRPVALPVYGVLPTAGYLDDKLKGNERDVSIVGFGLQSLAPPVQTGERTLGTTRIKSLDKEMVRGYGIETKGAKGTKKSGMCLGDSGGPLLHGDSNLVLAVDSFGDVDTCTGGNFAFRTDTASARAFLGRFVALP